MARSEPLEQMPNPFRAQDGICSVLSTRLERFLSRIFGFAEAGFVSGWSADILVRSVLGLNTDADNAVRAPGNRRCAPISP
jgi:hypothetical protein